MEVFINILIAMFLASIFLRSIVFVKLNEKWYKSLIPGYNIYTLGKLANSKKLGLLAGISNVLVYLVFFIYFCFETYLLQTGQLILYEGELIGIANSEFIRYMMNYILPYSWYFIVLIAWISWVFLMRKFSIKYNTSSWMMFIWALCPFIGYLYFVFRRQNE